MSTYCVSSFRKIAFARVTLADGESSARNSKVRGPVPTGPAVKLPGGPLVELPTKSSLCTVVPPE